MTKQAWLLKVVRRLMKLEEFRRYCQAKKGVTEEYPFHSPTLVFKVMGKIFVLADANKFKRINLKFDPVKAIQLREEYTAVIPGYHMNKRHWITVILDGSLDDRLICQWIDHSYDLVVSGLTRAQREELEAL